MYFCLDNGEFEVGYQQMGVVLCRYYTNNERVCMGRGAFSIEVETTVRGEQALAGEP